MSWSNVMEIVWSTGLSMEASAGEIAVTTGGACTVVNFHQMGAKASVAPLVAAMVLFKVAT
jgi:hypothetical protein